jgi:hypothetical protein
MVLLCKQKALYVKCCIIPNGITDSQGDTLYAEDIKKIFTSFNNQDNFEVYHNDLPIQEVSLLENYISTAYETIGTAVVPSGSWNAVIRVDNPEIKEALLTGEFKGVSLNNRIAEPCKANLTGQVRYQDVADAECIIPLLISFVEAGANGYGLHVMDYTAYIKKSKDIVINKNGAKRMDFKEFMDGLKSLIKQAEDTPEEEPAVEKEDDKTEEAEEPVVEKADEETTEEEATKEEDEAEIKKEDKAEEEEVADEEDEAEITKEDSDLEARVAKLEEQIAELLKEDTDAENPDPTVEPEDEDTPKITKSEKVVITNESEHVTQTNYYEMTGRDPVTGKKLR